MVGLLLAGLDESKGTKLREGAVESHQDQTLILFFLTKYALESCPQICDVDQAASFKVELVKHGGGWCGSLQTFSLGFAAIASKIVMRSCKAALEDNARPGDKDVL